MHKIWSNPEVQFTKTFWCFFLVSCLLFSANERLHRRRFAPSNCWPFGHGTSGTLAQKRVDWTMRILREKAERKIWEENEETIEKVHEQIQSFHETEKENKAFLLEVTKKDFPHGDKTGRQRATCSARYTMNRPFPLYRREPPIRFKARWCFSNMFVIFVTPKPGEMTQFWLTHIFQVGWKKNTTCQRKSHSPSIERRTKIGHRTASGLHRLCDLQRMQVRQAVKQKKKTHLAILRKRDLFGMVMWNRDPLKMVNRDLQCLGMKFGHGLNQQAHFFSIVADFKYFWIFAHVIDQLIDQLEHQWPDVILSFQAFLIEVSLDGGLFWISSGPQYGQNEGARNFLWFFWVLHC